MVQLHVCVFVLNIVGIVTADFEEIVYFMLSQGPLLYSFVHNIDTRCTLLVLSEIILKCKD